MRIAAHSTLPIKHTPLKVACLALFSSICSYGMGMMTLVHTHQTIAMRMPSLLTAAVNSFHQVNTFYDGTINCFSTLAQSRQVSNEMFTYKQALRESDYHEFMKAMIHEVNDHKIWGHCTCILCSDMPSILKQS
jgi:hypothetical protein